MMLTHQTFYFILPLSLIYALIIATIHKSGFVSPEPTAYKPF